MQRRQRLCHPRTLRYGRGGSYFVRRHCEALTPFLNMNRSEEYLYFSALRYL